MNAELAAKGVYSIQEQKSVTAWLDLRNKAAHGEYDSYNKEKVEILHDSVDLFLRQHPA